MHPVMQAIAGWPSRVDKQTDRGWTGEGQRAETGDTEEVHRRDRGWTGEGQRVDRGGTD